MDPKAQAMIQKGYHNSFLVIENFEKMKFEMKLIQQEMQKTLKSDITKFRAEVRETLQN